METTWKDVVAVVGMWAVCGIIALELEEPGVVVASLIGTMIYMGIRFIAKDV